MLTQKKIFGRTVVTLFPFAVNSKYRLKRWQVTNEWCDAGFWSADRADTFTGRLRAANPSRVPHSFVPFACVAFRLCNAVSCPPCVWMYRGVLCSWWPSFVHRTPAGFYILCGTLRSEPEDFRGVAMKVGGISNENYWETMIFFVNHTGNKLNFTKRDWDQKYFVSNVVKEASRATYETHKT